MTRSWSRDFDIDLGAIRGWVRAPWFPLVEQYELDLFRIRNLGDAARAAGLKWMHLPIREVSISTHAFEWHCPEADARIEGEHWDGRKKVVHCRDGLGRTGSVAVLHLRSFGIPSLESSARARDVRPAAVQTVEYKSDCIASIPPNEF